MYEKRKCSTAGYLEPGPYDPDTEHQECWDMCMTREDCGAIWVETNKCKLMDLGCTYENSVYSSSRTLYVRQDFTTVGKESKPWILT